jgi:hypothetical protein
MVRKPIGLKDKNGNDESIEFWKVIFKDNNGNYLRLERSNPNPPASISVPNADQDELANRYKKQQFKHIDCLFETNNSITLTVGTTNAQGSFSNLQHAGVYIDEAAAMPTSGTDAQIFDWAKSNFSWINTSFDSSVSEVKTGKWSSDSGGNISGAANGAHEHPYWRKTVTPTSLHIWDLRNYGHNTAQ